MTDAHEAREGTARKPYLLVVEDDEALLMMLRYNLEKLGYEVGVAEDGPSALAQVALRRPDLLLLDWMLPSLSGLDVCRRLREQEVMRTLPIIMLTARAGEADNIRGLDIGADDYVVKPCSIEALQARIRALLRRAPPADHMLRFADVTLDTVAHRAERNGRTLALGPTEYRILEFFLRHPRQVFSREDLLQRVWERGVHVELRTVDVHIRRLRLTLNGPGESDIVRTVRAAGYALDDPSQ
ncbi:phosphate regulon response regulator PhoB [Gluconacetobacter johannae DSM 13595]|uniref:Response regulator n=1 Tax=Gluconacetobacter johannae TaxID=112140 RepID=A0A7W4J7Q3_9PROT|nr:response regulator [Gluconacetobacter johannae]MBB2176212.1 response regulator [Gluconacetobacter johannae]GBQ89149.1 phosphate regulon response regulator PhoB [Gluconacetobacter johannae DSM 13595]